MSNGINYTQMAWIGSLPNDWECRSLRTLTYFINDSNADMRFTNVLSLLKDVGVVPYEKKGNQGNKSKEDLSNYKIAYKNTIVINSMNLKIGSVGLSKYDGCVSPVYYVLGIRKGNSIDYVNYLFQTKVFQEYLGSFGRGIMEIREKISKDDMKTALIPKPPLTTQNRIVAYLDKKIAVIDHQIEANKKAIDLLGEYRASEISRIVTKGLNENVELKDSGNIFIGKIPTHWEITKLRFLGKLQNGVSAEGNRFNEGFPFINYVDVYNNFSLPKSFSGVFDSNEKERKTYSIKKGDIFFTRTSETIEEVGLSSVCLEDVENGTFSGFLIRFRPYTNNVLPQFSKYYFRSDLHRNYFAKEMNIISRASLGQDLLKNLIVIIPPTTEQKEIVAYLDKRCKQIDQIITYRKAIIEKLEEYKKSLIYEAVTGKKEI